MTTNPNDPDILALEAKLDENSQTIERLERGALEDKSTIQNQDERIDSLCELLERLASFLRELEPKQQRGIMLFENRGQSMARWCESFRNIIEAKLNNVQLAVEAQ